MKRKAAQREITVLKRLSHPNLIKLHDLIDTKKLIYIFTDFVKGISLKEYSKAQRNRIIKEITVRRIFRQLAEAVYYLHKHNIVHRDIKLDNILMQDGTKAIKLIDFGFSVVTTAAQPRLRIFCGTPSYMSPEIVRKTEYEGKPVDMWALGVLLYQMLTGVFPFRGVSESELVHCDYLRGSDLKLTVFESVGSLHRQYENKRGSGKKPWTVDELRETHEAALSHLKRLGYSSSDIDTIFVNPQSSLMTSSYGATNHTINSHADELYQHYSQFIYRTLVEGVHLR